jgi:hypothetical protein
MGTRDSLHQTAETVTGLRAKLDFMQGYFCPEAGFRPMLLARSPELDAELTNAYEEIVSLDAKIEEYCST